MQRISKETINGIKRILRIRSDKFPRKNNPFGSYDRWVFERNQQFERSDHPLAIFSQQMGKSLRNQIEIE